MVDHYERFALHVDTALNGKDKHGLSCWSWQNDLHWFRRQTLSCHIFPTAILFWRNFALNYQLFKQIPEFLKLVYSSKKFYDGFLKLNSCITLTTVR